MQRKLAELVLQYTEGWSTGTVYSVLCTLYSVNYTVYTVSVLGQDEGYTVKYSPPSEGVPEGKARGISRRQSPRDLPKAEGYI